ncbi:MAG: DNA alkylation repair protein [Firmicutes bacterium]|nr:DNA alkylation repair protein [Bacillota bacterium]
MAYTEFDYHLLVTQLSQYSDAKYKQFQSGLAVGSSFLYGVRIPKLREISKHIASRDWKGYLNIAQDNSYEEIMLQGMVITQAKCSIEEMFEYTDGFVGKIDNWAICDTFCADFKAVRTHRQETWDYILKYVGSEKEFERRFAVVMLMDHFLIDDYVDQALEIMMNIDQKEYYVMMAVAWAVSTAFIKYRNKVVEILEEEKLPPLTHNKAIRKCRESYRVSSEDKEMLKGLKVKILK